MKVLVGYESRGGRTKRSAESIADFVREQGAEVKVAPLSAVGPADVADADLVFAGTWVDGFILAGVGPSRPAKHWLKGLPRLSGKPFAVFCTYGFNPRSTLEKMEQILADKGATVAGSRAINRRDPAAGTRDFVREVLAGVKT